MKLIFSKRLKRKELGSHPLEADLSTIQRGFFRWVYDSIKGEALPIGTHLIKVYATTVGGARRIVYMVDATTGDGFFLFYRTKNDPIGQNITLKNPEFKKKLGDYLKILMEDIGNDDLESVENS